MSIDASPCLYGSHKWREHNSEDEHHSTTVSSSWETLLIVYYDEKWWTMLQTCRTRNQKLTDWWLEQLGAILPSYWELSKFPIWYSATLVTFWEVEADTKASNTYCMPQATAVCPTKCISRCQPKAWNNYPKTLQVPLGNSQKDF